MTPEPSVVEGLKSIRPSLRLVWNNAARMIPGSARYDAAGRVVGGRYDPRWEVWDTDEAGLDYKFMTLEHDDGSFKPAGMWLVEVINFLNPARWNGDISRMARELVDKPNTAIKEISDREIEDLVDQVARWQWWVNTPKSRVLTNIA